VAERGWDAAPLGLPDGEGDAETTLLERLDLIGSRLPADAFSRICREILSATPDLIAQLNVAVRAGNRDDTTQLAHKLKGSMSTIGAMRLSSLAQRVEDGNRNGGNRNDGEILDQIHIEFRRAQDVIASRLPQGAST
jgi:HPt (histidine-containing phosphotransfer) domain-containing protein